MRVHEDAAGGWTALSLGARAVAIGHHIYFAPGESSGRDPSLLRHELAHVASQDPSLGINRGIASRTDPAERAARLAESGQSYRPSRVPQGIYRSPMARGDFQRQMLRFGVQRIFTATFEEQQDRLNFFGAGARPGDLLPHDTWAAWSPGSDSAVYDWIVAAFAGFARRLGGVPAVQEIGFFETDYKVNRRGDLVREPTVAASFGGGRMAIFRTAVDHATSFDRPVGRSADGTEARVEAMTPQQGVTQAVTHELGHGLVETALTPRDGPSGRVAPDAAFMRDYRREVGWTAGEPAQLFDAGVAEVRTALAAGTTPPAAQRIDETTWNAARWIEQPLTGYMTTHPSEDIAEAIAFFVNSPEILEQRSPRRFAFIESHQAALAPFLRRDLATVSLRPTDAQMREVIERGDASRGLRPVPPAAPAGAGSRVRFLPGPTLEIRF